MQGCQTVKYSKFLVFLIGPGGGAGARCRTVFKITPIHTHQRYILPGETNLTRCNGGDIPDKEQCYKKKSYKRIARAALHYVHP